MTDRDDVLRRMRELFQRWHAEHGENGRKNALGNLKGRVGALRSSRQRTIAWAESLLPVVEQARNELGASIGPMALADWLNDRHHKTSTGNRFRGPNLGLTLFSVDRMIAKDAVLECRTKMSALALSADFTVPPADAAPLEIECLERIKEGIVLARRLENRFALPEDQLTREARQMAIDESKRQRDDREYLPMIARDCYLTMAEFDEAVPDMERLAK
jgi:hypothetical protein